MDFNPEAFVPGDYLITQQNNKYYIQERNPNKILKTSNSEQSLHSPSPIHYRDTAKSPNHSILSNRNSYRDSSAKKNKNVTINTDLNLEYYENGKGMTEVKRSMNPPAGAEKSKTKKNSEVLKLHYGKNLIGI